MADETKAAASAGLDMTALAALIATSVATAVADATKPLHEAIGKLAAPAPAAPAAAAKAEEGKAAKAISLEDVASLLDAREAKRSAGDALAQQRNAFAAEKLKDLPATYREKLGADPAKWPAEEQAIRATFKADFAALGGKVPAVSGATGTGEAAVAGKVDFSKMSPIQKIHHGLKAHDSAHPPVGGGEAKAADAAAT